MRDVSRHDKRKQTVVVANMGTAQEPFGEGSCPKNGQVEAVGDEVAVVPELCLLERNRVYQGGGCPDLLRVGEANRS